MATRKPPTDYCPTPRWSLDDLVAALFQRHPWTMSRSRVWRLLDEADLKPHRSVYWLNSHDPDFESKAHDICPLYLNALRFFAQDRLVICTDEKTGRQILERRYPTQPLAPGKPEKREHEYIRHGTRALRASFVVPTGQVVWNLSPTRTSVDFAAHLAQVVKQLPDMHRYDWVVDTLNTHWSLEVCRLVAQWCKVPLVANDLRRGGQRRAFLSDPSHKHVFHFTPKHGSWLNRVELWLSVWPVGFFNVVTSVQRKTLQPVCVTLLRSITPIRRIRIVGRIRGNHWYGLHRLARHAVSNVMVEPGLALGPNDLSESFIRPGRTRGLPLDWQRMYETDI